MKFYVSLDAHEATLANGRPLVKGEYIELSPEDRGDPFNARLIAERQLISVSQEDKAIKDAEEVLANPPAVSTLPPPDPNAGEGGTTPNTEGGAES